MPKPRPLASVLVALSLIVLWLLGAPAQAFGQEQIILEAQSRFHPVVGRQGMVATQEAVATRIGLEVLRSGGNAVDATVAVGFALAVTLPRAGNLGGGGFMLVHMADRRETVAIDYREKAAARAYRDLFLDEGGQVDKRRARFSPLSVGVPGTVAGLALALNRYGTLPLREIVAPAIRLAADGIVVTPDLAHSLEKRKTRLSASPATRAIFFKPDGSAYEAGDRLIQRDLAWSLGEIARDGASAFYEGEIAKRLALHMQATGGLIDAADLGAYRALVRKPIIGTYRGYQVASMPPPSSGGVHLVQMLNVLEGFSLARSGHNSAATIHLMAEVMKRAYADRSKYLGDPDFHQVPVAALTSSGYAKHLSGLIDRERATPSIEIAPGEPGTQAGRDTTHFSVVDRWSNAVSNTYTLNFSYGTGIVAKRTGILLNNEMDDFSAKPGIPNAYGLIGGEANAIAGGKRPLSSMTPTIVFKDGGPTLVTGTPGGSRIITTVLQLILNVVDHGMNVAEATAAARIHHQWLPDELRIERGLSPDTIALLEAKGHRMVLKSTMGSTQSIMRKNGLLLGVSDPRRPGALTLGY